MPTEVSGKSPPPFFREVYQLLDELEPKVGLFCFQFGKATGLKKEIMRDDGLKIQARLAVLKARLDISLDDEI